MARFDSGNAVKKVDNQKDLEAGIKKMLQEEIKDETTEEVEVKTPVVTKTKTSKPKKKDKNFALRLEETDFLFLEKMAEEEERSVNHIICKAIKDYIKKHI